MLTKLLSQPYQAATVSLILYSGGKSTARGVCTIICARMPMFRKYQAILVICTIISASRCVCEVLVDQREEGHLLSRRRRCARRWPVRIAARVHRALTVTQNTKSGGISHGCLQYDAEHHSSMDKHTRPKLESETESHRIER